MAFVERVFPHGFRKTENANTTPRVRFEAIAIGSYLALKDHPTSILQTETYQMFPFGSKVKGSRKYNPSDAANVKSKLLRRLEFVRNALVEG